MEVSHLGPLPGNIPSARFLVLGARSMTEAMDEARKSVSGRKIRSSEAQVGFLHDSWSVMFVFDEPDSKEEVRFAQLKAFTNHINRS